VHQGAALGRNETFDRKYRVTAPMQGAAAAASLGGTVKLHYPQSLSTYEIGGLAMKAAQPKYQFEHTGHLTYSFRSRSPTFWEKEKTQPRFDPTTLTESHAKMSPTMPPRSKSQGGTSPTSVRKVDRENVLMQWFGGNNSGNSKDSRAAHIGRDRGNAVALVWQEKMSNVTPDGGFVTRAFGTPSRQYQPPLL